MSNPPLIVGLLINVIEAEGIEFIGPVHEWEPTGEAWSHFRAPDGNVYEITHGPKHRQSAARFRAPDTAEREELSGSLVGRLRSCL